MVVLQIPTRRSGRRLDPSGPAPRGLLLTRCAGPLHLRGSGCQQRWRMEPDWRLAGVDSPARLVSDLVVSDTCCGSVGWFRLCALSRPNCPLTTAAGGTTRVFARANRVAG